MELNQPKKLYFALALFFLMFALFLSFALFFGGKGAFGGVFLRKNISFSVKDNEGNIVLSEKIAKELPEGGIVLKVKNNEKESLGFSLYQNGKEKVSFSLAPSEEREVKLDSSGKPLSLFARKGKEEFAYLSDLESLEAITEKMENGGDITALLPLKGEKIFLNSPFRFFGNFRFDEINIETVLSGKIVLCPDRAFSGEIYTQAPLCEVFYKNFSPDFPKEDRDFYFKAKSLNGKRLSLRSFPISSFEKLKRLADESLLPKMPSEAKITFTAPFQIKESVSLKGLASLNFSSPVDFCGNTITFSSDEKGEYSVKTALGANVGGTSLIFLSPKSSLLWEGAGQIPDLSTIEKGSNVKNYNGTPLTLGGEGEGIPVLSLSAENYDLLTSDVFFFVKGNLLCATLPYLFDKKSLDEGDFSLSCENAEVFLEGNLSNGTIVTKDHSGKERRFRVEILREAMNIPVVNIETENGAEIVSKSQYISATFSMDGGKSEYSSLSESHIRIRGRGNSTWKWEKKPYKIHFDEPTSLLGLPKAEEWALVSNYADKSLMRNHLAQKMASELSFAYCPTQAYVDVFLNGEYLGVYTLGEHLEAGEGRVEVDYDPNAIDCGYFLEAGGVVSGVDVKGMNYFHAGLVKFVLIKSPDYNTLTSEQFNFIKEYMLKADEAVKKGEGYEEYLDIESVIDWLIMTELSCNTDCSWRRSTYFVKDPGGKLVMGPVWDFDLAFGNFSKDNPGDDTWVSSEPEDDYVGETWSTYLLKDPEFQKAFKKRWQEVSKSLMDTALSEIEKDYRILSPSAELNFERWDILGRKVAFERHDTTEYKTYSSQIYYLQDFLIERAAWIDAQVENW